MEINPYASYLGQNDPLAVIGPLEAGAQGAQGAGDGSTVEGEFREV